MKTTIRNTIGGMALVPALILTLQPTTARAQGTAFTYQGRLEAGGTPYTGLAEMQFSLWDAASGGSQLGTTLTVSPVGVSNGLFTVSLDFGTGVFTGPARWLEIGVRTNLLGFTTLSPRQPVTATPYAVLAGNVSGVIANSSLPANPSFSGTVSGGSFAGSGAGLTGLNASQLTSGTVPDGRLGANVARTNQVWLLGGNAGTTPGTHFLGTTDNQPLELRVNGQRALRIEPDADSPNLVGGSASNSVAPGLKGVTIAGGGLPLYPNRITNHYAAIGGGMHNLAGGAWATIAGGRDNLATGRHSTVGGGSGNIASGSAATVSGGDFNSASNSYSTVGGGVGNIASGSMATVG
ncbi:MAG TPA: hypothetical protein VNO52_05505, partial [Methylomirabilota bacterium]|nr:hypothetical protein [Methylomirabilota bacterium]